MVKAGKIAGRAILMAGPPSSGKTAIGMGEFMAVNDTGMQLKLTFRKRLFEQQLCHKRSEQMFHS